MGLWAGALGVLVLGLATQGCGSRRAEQGPPSDPSVQLELVVTPQPARAGTYQIAVTLTEARTKAPLPRAVVRVEGNMTHPGMVPVEAMAQETRPGVYEAPLELKMAGDWVVSVDATLSDGRSAHEQVDVPGVPAPG